MKINNTFIFRFTYTGSIIFCLFLLIGCAPSLKLDKYVTENIKSVSLSNEIFFENDSIQFRLIASSSNSPGLPGLGVLSAALKGIGASVQIRKMKERLNESIGGGVNRIVKNCVYLEFTNVIKEFDIFKHIDKNSSEKADAEFVLVVNSFGYEQHQERGNYYPYCDITCYLIENPPFNLRDTLKLRNKRLVALEPEKHKVLWKSTAKSSGTVVELNEFALKPNIVEKGIQEACNATAKVLFYSMQGIKAY